MCTNMNSSGPKTLPCGTSRFDRIAPPLYILFAFFHAGTSTEVIILASYSHVARSLQQLFKVNGIERLCEIQERTQGAQAIYYIYSVSV